MCFKSKKHSDRELPEICRFCVYATVLEGTETMLCSKKGVVGCEYHCRKFSYDPLKHIPPPSLTQKLLEDSMKEAGQKLGLALLEDEETDAADLSSAQEKTAVSAVLSAPEYDAETSGTQEPSAAVPDNEQDGEASHAAGEAELKEEGLAHITDSESAEEEVPAGCARAESEAESETSEDAGHIAEDVKETEDDLPQVDLSEGLRERLIKIREQVLAVPDASEAAEENKETEN